MFYEQKATDGVTSFTESEVIMRTWTRLLHVHLLITASSMLSLLFAVEPLSADPAPSDADTVTVLTYIDGPSELHVTKEGMYWFNGSNAKPGRHEGHNYATYV